MRSGPAARRQVKEKIKKVFFKKIVDGMFLVSYTDPRYER